MGDWEVDVRTAGATVRAIDAAAEAPDDVLDSWDAEPEEDLPKAPAPKVDTAAEKAAAKAEKLKKRAAEEARKKELEALKNEDPEARKARIKAESERAAAKDVGDLFGAGSDEGEPEEEFGGSVGGDSKKGGGSKAPEKIVLDTKPQFVKYATSVAAVLVEGVGGKSHKVPFAGEFMKTLLQQSAPALSEASLKELTGTISAILAEKKTEKVKAKKGAKGKAKGVGEEEGDEFFKDYDDSYDALYDKYENRKGRYDDDFF